jgi:hypothetical protein
MLGGDNIGASWLGKAMPSKRLEALYTEQMSDKERPSKSKGRRISEAEIDARSYDEELRRWRGKLFFNTSATTVDEIAQRILQEQERSG